MLQQPLTGIFEMLLEVALVYIFEIDWSKPRQHLAAFFNFPNVSNIFLLRAKTTNANWRMMDISLPLASASPCSKRLYLAIDSSTIADRRTIRAWWMNLSSIGLKRDSNGSQVTLMKSLKDFKSDQPRVV